MKNVKKIESIPVESLEVLKLEADDVLMIKSPALLDTDSIAAAEKRLSEKLGCKVVVFDPCFEAQGILRAQKAAQS